MRRADPPQTKIKETEMYIYYIDISGNVRQGEEVDDIVEGITKADAGIREGEVGVAFSDSPPSGLAVEAVIACTIV